MVAIRPDELSIELAGGVRVVVPRDLGVLSTFVFLEREDWFEAEAGFVRALAGSLRAALDVGANFGFYAATLAAGGADVLAVEPHPALAERLRRALAGDRVRVVEAAAGAAPGTTRFGGHAHVEGSRAAGDGAFTVAVGRLDDLVPPGFAERLDFVKIDVEGGEVAAIAGGEGLLRAAAPLVMVEIKDGADFDLAPLAALEGLGFARYRLLPGLGVLVPMGPAPDSQNQINAFAATPARAAALAGIGRLCVPEPVSGAGDPFALWARHADASAPAAARAGALLGCFDAFAAARAAAPGLAADLSFARVAAETGRELAGALALRPHVDAALAGDLAWPQAPFLWPIERYARADAEPALRLRACVIEAFHAMAAPSSLFAPAAGREAGLAFVVDSGLAAPETVRRLYLYRLATGRKAAAGPHLALLVRSAGNLNPDFWRMPALYG